MIGERLAKRPTGQGVKAFPGDAISSQYSLLFPYVRIGICLVSWTLSQTVATVPRYPVDGFSEGKRLVVTRNWRQLLRQLRHGQVAGQANLLGHASVWKRVLSQGLGAKPTGVSAQGGGMGEGLPC